MTRKGVELEVECNSTAKALYHSPGHPWNPKLALNALKSTSAAVVFKNSPGHWFYLQGTDALFATLYVDLR